MNVHIPKMRMLRLPRRKSGKSHDGEMPLMEHLNELRRRLFCVVLAILIGTLLGFAWFGHALPLVGMRSLGDIVIDPYCAVPPEQRVTFGLAGACKLLATGPFSALELQLKAALIAGVVLTSPIWLYQLWAFITPGLYVRERKYVVTFVSTGAVLFTLGAVLAYVVIREGLTVLLGFGGDTSIAALSPESYFSFLSAMLLIFGVSFELPLLLIMLNQIGLISSAKLASSRRYSIFAIVVFAGLVVPGNDALTMMSLALALIVLFELSVLVTRLHDKRQIKRERLVELTDDQASPLPYGDPVDQAADLELRMVAAPEPIPHPRSIHKHP